MPVPDFEEKLSQPVTLGGMEDAFAVFEYVEEHVLDYSVLLSVYAH